MKVSPRPYCCCTIQFESTPREPWHLRRILTRAYNRHRVGIAHPHEPSLDQEIPHPTRLIDVDLHEVARLAPSELPAPPRILAHERLLDDEVRLGQDAQLRAQRLLLGREQVQRGAVRQVQWRSYYSNHESGGEGRDG